MFVYDYLLGDDLDLVIEDGDFSLGESTEQHIQLIAITEKGAWKAPSSFWVGAGIRDLLNDDANPIGFKKEQQKQMELDGMVVTGIEIKGVEAQIDGYYADNS